MRKKRRLPPFVPSDEVPLPPVRAQEFSTVCDYCVVGCGFKVYRWRHGGKGLPDRNATGRAFPLEPGTPGWISPNMHNVVLHRGRKHHVIVMPDPDMKTVNRGGDHSIRGGCLAQKCYSPDGPTSDRLKTPLLRVGGILRPIDWPLAIELFAEATRHTIERHGRHAWGLKQFNYGYFENTYALSKLALGGIGTPVWAEHDQPGSEDPTPAWRDIGLLGFAPSYEDWYQADVLMICGSDPFETKTVLWNDWIKRAIDERGQKVIMINPRRTPGAQYAEAHGGRLIQVNPGSDQALLMAIQRVILERGWQDTAWIARHTADGWEASSGTGRGDGAHPAEWRRGWDKLGARGFADYRDWLLAQQESQPGRAARLAGIDAGIIEELAALLAKPKADGSRPKASFAMEKGLFWSNNYGNTAALGTLALLCGSGNRPGRVAGRLGGHQLGMVRGGDVDRRLSPDRVAGDRRRSFDVDRWVAQGKVRFMWVVGTTWMTAMCASAELADAVRSMTRGHDAQLTSVERASAVDAIRRRIDGGGMFLVHQDIYLRPTIGAELADLVLPAAGWGEASFTRCNGERRLRLYPRFYDPPGDAKPDWWIAAQIARKLGLEGYAWNDGNDVFEEAARASRGTPTDFYPLVWLAKKLRVKGHEMVRRLGTTGIQCPIRYEGGRLVGTARLHDSTLELPTTGPEGPTVWLRGLKGFDTHSGKARFVKAPWSLWGDFYEAIAPGEGELWITSGRINELWQSRYDDARKPYIQQRWPENFVELHPDDAAARGIESGDFVRAFSDRVPVQTGGAASRDFGDALYSGLDAAGHIKKVRAEVRAVAVVSPAVKKGVAFMAFLHPKHPANNLAPAVPDPISGHARFKMGVGQIEKVGESPYKEELTRMSFAPRAWKAEPAEAVDETGAEEVTPSL